MKTICIDRNGKIDNNGLSQYTNYGITIFFDGLIYVYGKKAGTETIKWLCEEYNKNRIIPFSSLHGSFSCYIYSDNSIVAFTDNSNMHSMYYSENGISNSFLKLLKQELKAGNQVEFDPVALCEYYTLGNIFFDKTFFKQINNLNSNEVLYWGENSFHIKEKGIDGIDGNSDINSISAFFDQFTYSVSDLKICQALTGGYDSRLVYICTSKRMNDHPAISSNKMDDPDVIHAMEVARINGNELDIVSIQKPEMTKELLDKLLMYLDGIQPIDIESNIRLFTFKKHLAQNYDIHLTGDGGVLHKDWEWTQDFPLYRRKKSDAKKFYQQRLYYIRNDNHLGDKLKPVFSNQQARFVDCLQHISKPLNTQSYDSWYYLVSGNRRVAYNNNVFDGFVSYAPLLEIDLVKFSYALPRFDRFFYNSMRKTMTTENVKVARLATNYGTTASSEKRYIIRDCFYQAIEYARKAIRVLSRKLLNKSILNNNVLDWSLEQSVRSSQIAKEAVEFARKYGYINSIDIKELSYIELQRLIHIHWLAQHINIE